MALEAETLDVEGFEEGEAAESAEATRGRVGPRIPNSYMQRSFGPQPAVSQPQLQAALNRVDSSLRKVSDVETAISSRVSALSAAAKKETAERKKALDSQVKDLNEKLGLLALFPLLVQAPTVSNPQAGGQPLKDGSGNVITSISAPDPSKLDAILPLLLVSGMGTSTGTGGGGLLGGDGGSGSLLLLALILAFSGK